MSRKLLYVAAVGLASIASLAIAQNAPDNGGGQGQGQQGGPGEGGRGGRGNFDPAQFQQRMMERLKEQMKAPDDEWNVIQPKLEKVMTAQREARAGGMGGGFGGRGGPGGGGGRGGNDNEQSETAKASRELRDTLQSDNASADQIQAKLKAFRDARAKAEDNLKSAREDLKSVLNDREEAVLVMAGMIE